MDILVDSALLAKARLAQLTGKSGTGATSFAELLHQSALRTDEAEAAAAQTAEALERYKNEFRQKLEAIQFDESLEQAKIAVKIADAAFLRMMDDPEFEAEIWGFLLRDMTADFSVAKPAFSIYRVDADGEYSASCGGGAWLGVYETEAADAFWRREPVDSGKDKAEAGNPAGLKRPKSAKQKREEQEWLEELVEKERLRAKAETRTFFRELSERNYAEIAEAGGTTD